MPYWWSPTRAKSGTRACALVMDLGPLNDCVSHHEMHGFSRFKHRIARRRFPPLRDLIIIGHLLAHSGSMSGLFPPPHSPDEEHMATPGISIATSPSLLVSSVGKCYCNTCSSRHIPLALTLQPLPKLGPAIRRDRAQRFLARCVVRHCF
jgi:hypothetical protein